MSTISKNKHKKLAPSVPITNNPKLLQFLVNNQTQAYQTKKRPLTASMGIELFNLFGSPNKQLNLEYRPKVWVLTYSNLKFNVFTAEGLGTNFEICDQTYLAINSGEYEAEIITFLQTLMAMLY